MTSIFSQAEELFPYTQNLRRDFHRHPELGFQEHRTAEIIVRELSKLEDMVIQDGIAGTGVVGTLKGGKPGRVILLRFDMDALPVEENTGVDYSSENEGLMHACGHDGHLAIGLTTARLLHEGRENLPGTIKFVFQPAEEGLGGAVAMIKEGILSDPVPEVALALHLWNEKPLGWIGITDGPMMSASETFQVEITGKGGHGGKPHESIDPIVAAAGIINVLQSIVSREIPPLDSGVITVSSIHGGEAHNVVPEQVILSGTIRSFTEETRDLLLKRFHEVVEQTSAAYLCRARITIEDISPAVNNDPKIAAVLRQTAGELFPQAVIDQGYRTMASEDMAFMMQEIPGCYCLIGSADSERGLDAKHHQPEFNFDERALTQGVALLVSAVQDLLKD
ncbi:MAG: amidohydrolase [Anaerolineales bacterium]|nr:amidohydrolase [Anaerolineales bacterium]